jgi:hypothetical protein
MSGTPEPAAPGTVAPAVVQLTQADLSQLLEAVFTRAKTDVEAGPSAFMTGIKNTFADAKANLPMIVISLMAAAGLALHFVKLPL